MDPTLVLAALFVFGGLLTYTMVERRHRANWRRYERQTILRTRDEDDPFRRDLGPAGKQDVLVQSRAPRVIRRTALWSIYMGQMAVPGGLLGMVGVVFGGLGLIGIPGMILAVRIWRLGYAMLRRDEGAELEARKLARFAEVLNVVAVIIGAALWGIGGHELAPIAIVLFGYGAVSFAHAAAMRRCAAVLGLDRRLREQYERERELAEAHAGWRARGGEASVGV